jgi:uncharacterized SAM-binding protein YcdF (DUF218 family)
LRARRRLVPAAAFLLIVLGIAWLTREAWLRAIGASLIESADPRRSDAILVLAGDFRGNRILKACELARHGFAPTILVSGPMDLYGVNEADLAVAYATARGCPASMFTAMRLRAFSTEQEAHALEPEIARRSIRTLLLVTSSYHTARAAGIFRRVLGSDVQVIPVAAPDPYFSEDKWWRMREGQKTVFFEGSKTIAGWIGL